MSPGLDTSPETVSGVLYCKQWIDQIIGSLQVYVQYYNFDFNMAEAVVVLRSVA